MPRMDSPDLAATSSARAAIARSLTRSAALLAAAIFVLGAGGAWAVGVRAGVGVAALPAPHGGPLGGYGGLTDRRATGVLDPPQARALLIEQGALRIGIVSIDVVIVRPQVREALLERARKLDLGALLLVATHTHSGPGGFVEGWLGERMTAGSFDPARPAQIAAAAEEALAAAETALAPVRLAAGEGSLDLARNRRRPGGPRETALPVLEVTSLEGRRVARVFAYGVHGVALGPTSHDHSADLIGVARRILDDDEGVSIFLPGPLGDQNPMHETLDPWPDDVAAQRDDATAWGTQMARAVAAVRFAQRVEAPLAEREIRPAVPPVVLRRGSLLWWLSPLVRSQIAAFVPQTTVVQAIRLGNACLVALPAEPATEVGDAARRLVPAGCVPFVIAHANDWLGYALTPEDYARGGYEADLSLPGQGFAAWLLSQAAEAARVFTEP